jgi:ABC-type dipeptide/oligopeptide/nickel transport system permease subunit
VSAGLLTSAKASSDAGVAVVGRSHWGRFRTDHFALAGLILVGILTLAALAAGPVSLLVHHGPNQLFPSELNSFGLPAGLSLHFLLGADEEGRDLLVRCLYGLGTSLTVSLLATLIGVTIGVTTGLCAGLFGGWVDMLIGRAADVFLAVPIVLVAISVSSVCSVSPSGCVAGTVQPGVGLVVAILALASWPYIARIVRGQTLLLKQQEFVLAARAFGASSPRVMFQEILPNLTSQVLVVAALLIPTNVLFEATLSFLGVGIPPTTPSLGGILAESTTGSLYTDAWWMMVFPGALLLMLTIGFTLVADGIRDVLAG